MQITFVLALALFSTVNCLSNEKLFRVPIQRQSNPILTKRMSLGYTTALYNDMGSQYLIQLSIGTPAQNFTVTLDTGSADLWVPASSCPRHECPNDLFDPSLSSTYKPLDTPFTLAYGIGNVNGTYATDRVSIGGLTVDDQQFGLASDTQNILTNPSTITVATDAKLSRRSNTVKSNGILGLGYPRLTASYGKSKREYSPFVFNLADRISQPVFSIYMNDADKDGWVGEILFGGVDETKYKGNLTYMPVVDLSAVSKQSSSEKYYWMVGAQGLAAGDLKIKFNTTSAYILDTGTTLTYLPDPIALSLVEAIAGNYSVESSSGTYMISCDLARSNRSLELVMTGQQGQGISLKVPASQLVIPLDGTTAANSKSCLFGIAPSGQSSGQMHLIGDSVLRSAYWVFDIKNNTVGMAASVGFDSIVKSANYFPQTSQASKLSPLLYITILFFLL